MSLKTIEDYQRLPQITQKSDAWFEKRQQMLTATKIASVLHLNSYHTYHDLLAGDLSHREPIPEQITPNMVQENQIDPRTWGTVLEPVARDYLEKRDGYRIGELGLRVHPQIYYLGASPDGIRIVNDQDGVGLAQPCLVEIKCPMRRKITSLVPLEYWVQTQIGMEVWDVDQTLYAELKFKLTTDRAKWLQAQQEIGGCRILAAGLLFNSGDSEGRVSEDRVLEPVYWMLKECVTQIIPRDREWFRRIKCQIAHFYSLKFLKPKLNLTEQISGSKRKRGRETIQAPPKKRAKNSYYQQIATIEQEIEQSEEIIPSVSKKASLHPHLVAIGRLSNYLRQDPILDWLECHGTDYGFQRKHSLFLDYYSQLNLRYKLKVFRDCRKICQKQGWTYRILNASLNNLINLPTDGLLLKLQYDCHLLEETQASMALGLDLIMMGQLGIDVNGYTVWDTYDLLVKKERFLDFFPGESNQRILEILETNEHWGGEDCDGENWTKETYLPIKIKYTTLDFLKGNVYLKSKHRVDVFKMGAITTSLLMGRPTSGSGKDGSDENKTESQFGLIPKMNQTNEIAQGIQWLKDVHFMTDWRGNLYPNMKNRYDSQWHQAKTEIARECEELTQVAYLGIESRNWLHQQGVYRISELQSRPDLIEQLGTRLPNYLLDELELPRLELDREVTAEVFLDFENVSNLGTGHSLVFLMGMIIRKKELGEEQGSGLEKKETPFLSLVSQDLSQESERAMLEEGLRVLANLGDRVIVYHWSQAEPRILKEAGYQLPENCEWYDLYDHFVKQGASLPGCYTYGLKDVAETLFKLGLIQSRWQHGLDGTQAMVLAWWTDLKCRLTKRNFGEHADVLKIREYNRVDVQVLEEIRDLLAFQE